MPLLSHPEHKAALHHWELPSKDPDRIILTWSEDPSATQSVTWRTSSVIEQAFAEIAFADPSSRFDANAIRVAAKTTSLDIGGSDKNTDRTDHYHSVVFRDLEPDTLYAYRVGDGTVYWSEWIQFRTASAGKAPLKFLYYGDAQNGVLSHWSRIVRAGYSHAPDAAFVIHAGDLINRAHRDHEWAEWFKAGGWIHASIPSIPVPGNHEYDEMNNEDREAEKLLSLQWRPQFTLPVETDLPESLAETVYAVRIQGVLIVALNSNEQGEVQAKWLDELLAEDDSAWRVLTFHHPIFSSGRDRDNSERRKLLKPVIDKHSVDLVLQGHDHTYARGHVPLRVSDADATAVETMYVNSVSGAKMYDFMADGWKVYEPDGVLLNRKAENTQFFQVISIDGDTLAYEARTADGALYDSFKLRKDSAGLKRFEVGGEELPAERLFENSMPYSKQGL